MKCANCGKGVMWGHNVSHSKRRTNRVFRPNLHSTKITIGGRSKRVRLCTKCLRLMKQAMKLQNASKAPQTAEVTAA